MLVSIFSVVHIQYDRHPVKLCFVRLIAATVVPFPVGTRKSARRSGRCCLTSGHAAPIAAYFFFTLSFDSTE
jgi:hypothetical protein